MQGSPSVRMWIRCIVVQLSESQLPILPLMSVAWSSNETIWEESCSWADKLYQLLTGSLCRSPARHLQNMHFSILIEPCVSHLEIICVQFYLLVIVLPPWSVFLLVPLSASSHEGALQFKQCRLPSDYVFIFLWFFNFSFFLSMRIFLRFSSGVSQSGKLPVENDIANSSGFRHFTCVMFRPR